MPWTPHTPEHRAKITASLRRGKLDKIADPLWHAIHHGRTAEADRLMAELSVLCEKDKAKKAVKETECV